MTRRLPMKLRIAFLGDSITVGDGDCEARGWPSRLLEKTRYSPEKKHCYNLGVGGDRMGDVKARCASELAARLSGKDGTAVVIMIGLNDALAASATVNRRALDPTRLATDMEFIIQTSRHYGPVIVVEPTPVLMSLSFDNGAAGTEVIRNLETLCAITKSVCERLGVPVVPMLKPLSNDNVYTQALAENDALHPTSSGHVRIAARIHESEHWQGFIAQITG